ncbi:venom allergen 5 2-like [Anthonomus grandis grandis]|uniref:venom allergen 5 2-like n=1 Tax=Anthonomus grandis grandis TaxID=2921223 RepID=UPI002166023D|nr:venom allergen 5 2-like [Anthonomus grandis grandis]
MHLYTKSIIFQLIYGICFIATVSACQRQILRANGVTEEEKRTIIDHHNKMRQSVALGQIGGQPPASNMMEMKWDDELANRAQWWASSCHSERHDKGRHNSRFPVGQNIATTWTTKPPSSYEDIESNFPYAMSKWFDEYKFFNFGGIGSGKTGHYTQMLWAETNLVGCGFAFYFDPSQGYTKNYVCNYGPGGNVRGQPPYEKGYPSCNQFGLQESRQYSGLCSKPSNYYFGISNFILDRISRY